MYYNVLKFSFKQSLVYGHEVAAVFIRKAIQIGGILLFWSILAQGSTTNLNVKELLSYFLIAGAVSEFVMANLKFGRNTMKKIKNGEINIYAIRPVNIIYYLYSSYVGSSGLDYILGIISLTIGLLINPPRSIVSVLLFLIFLVLATILSFGINVLVAVLAFLTTEASSIKNVISHIIRVLSGAIVPISFFPGFSQTLVKLTPFPYLVFGPANALRTTSFSNQVLVDLTVATFWTILLYFFALLAWKQCFKKYEAIGI
jgi:ABC-2 type transport system permease protein